MIITIILPLLWILSVNKHDIMLKVMVFSPAYFIIEFLISLVNMTKCDVQLWLFRQTIDTHNYILCISNVLADDKVKWFIHDCRAYLIGKGKS